MKTKQLTYNIMLQPEPEGGFTVIVPSLPGCVTYGKDLKEAKAMAQDAISCYLASLEKHNEEVYSDDESIFFSSVQVTSDSPHVKTA